MEPLFSSFMLAASLASPLAALMIIRARGLAAQAQASTQALEQVIENLSEGYYRSSLEGTQLSANPALVALNGFKDEAELLANLQYNETQWYVEPERRAEFFKLLNRDGKVENFTSEIYRYNTRERIWVSENARMVRDPKTGRATHYEGTITEITEIMVRQSEQERLVKLTSHVPGGLFQLVRHPDATFEVPFASYGFNEMLDSQSASQSFDINHFVSLIHPEDINAYHLSLRVSRKTGRLWSQDFRVVTDHGKTKWLKVQGTPDVSADGTTTWHGYLQDITVTKADEAQIKTLAYSDQLTKLPNRRSLIDRLNQSLANTMRRKEYAAVLFVDLDNFKAINDRFGHDAGDQLLLEVSKKLRQVVRRSDTVARLGGDEFVVLLDGLGGNQKEANKKIYSVLENILASFQVPIMLASVSHKAHASIGAVAFCDEGYTADEILHMADTAMYEVKKSGRNAFKVFENKKDPTAIADAQILADLPNIVARQELELCFQPQMDRAGKICGAEALIRWNHPKLGVLSPDRFMPVARLSGLSDPIDDWVIDKALETLGAWQGDEALSKLTLAINAVPHYFANEAVVGRLRNLANSNRADLSRLKLEFTDKTISANREQSLTVMQGLKDAGVFLSLADFGINSTALSHLGEMPLDEIKIDGDFIKSVSKRPKDKALAKSIVAMAEALGLSTVAEHVETPAQERLLMEYGCVQFQGFLYGSAIKQTDFEASVHQNAIALGLQHHLRNVA